MKDVQTIILAAGKGTRMKSDIPKVLHKVCGKAILQYVLDVAKNVGSLKNYVVLGHKSLEVQDYLGKNEKVIEQKKLLGTADAVKCAQRYFSRYSGNVLVLCGDTPLLSTNTIKRLIKRHKKSDATCTFLTCVVHNPQGYGRIIRGENGGVVAIREDKDASGYEREIAEINVGAYCFKAKQLFGALKEIKLSKKKEYYLTDVIELLSTRGEKVDTVETEDQAEGLGVNTREDLAQAEEILRGRILKDFMLSGVTITDPSSTHIDASVKIGKDTTIHPFTIIENSVKIGTRCQVGPFARLRAGTKIANDVQIGNYTEVSRTKIGNKSLMKHFSYLGDATVGTHVNIGAGTITANYDGKQKNVTKIADHAFIGCDSILIAPVKVGRRAVVGAGSVVPKGQSIPDNKLVVGVPASIITRRKDK